MNIDSGFLKLWQIIFLDSCVVH